MDIATFRATWPGFADTTAYPDAAVGMWLTLAGKVLDPLVWRDYLDLGTGLFVAHNLTMDLNAALGKTGLTGIVAGKSVGSASVSYDAAAVAIAGAGQWNATTYGARYFQLQRLVGTGGVQL